MVCGTPWTWRTRGQGLPIPPDQRTRCQRVDPQAGVVCLALLVQAGAGERLPPGSTTSGAGGFCLSLPQLSASLAKPEIN